MDFTDYKNSRYLLKDIEYNFKKINDSNYVFNKKMNDLSFIIEGRSFNDEFHVDRKFFMDKENRLHSNLNLSNKIYAEVVYKNFNPFLINNFYEGKLDSFMTSSPSYEIMDGEIPKRLWYVLGVNKTSFVRKFCNENGINISKISSNEIELILLNLTK